MMGENKINEPCNNDLLEMSAADSMFALTQTQMGVNDMNVYVHVG